MSCFSCQICSCSCTSETTELILYPTTNLTSRRSLQLNDRIFKVKRTKKQSVASTSLNPDQNNKDGLENFKFQYKPGQTMDTISKIRSIRSSHVLKQKMRILIDKSLQQSQLDVDKQNKNNNFFQSHYQSIQQKPKQSIYQLSKEKVTQSQIFQRKSINQQKILQISQINIVSPHSSTLRQKKLQVILLEKQNDQLKDELIRLKAQQKQLLEQQFKIKQKNNRQLGILKKKSQQIQSRSNLRKKQLQQLKSMLQMVKKRTQSNVGNSSNRTKINAAQQIAENKSKHLNF